MMINKLIHRWLTEQLLEAFNQGEHDTIDRATDSGSEARITILAPLPAWGWMTSPLWISASLPTKRNQDILWSPRYLPVIRLCDHMPGNFWKTCLNWVGGWINDLRGLLQLQDSMTQTQQNTSCVESNSKKPIFQSLLGGGEVLWGQIKAPVALGQALLLIQAKGNENATKNIKGQNLALEQEDGWRGSHDLQ